MAARNRHFRIAILLVAATYLLFTVRESIEAVHFIRDRIAVEARIGVLISAVAHLIGAGGWTVIATAFGVRLDRSRLLLGGIIVGSAYVALFVGSVFELIPVLADEPNADLRGLYRWGAIAAILLVVAAAVVIVALLEDRRGPALAPRLQIGLAFATLGVGALTVSFLYQQSYDSSRGYVHALPAGALVRAIGELGIALSALAATLALRRPLAQREGRLAAAATGAAFASLCLAVGEGIVAFASSSYGSPTWVVATVWIDVANSLALLVAYSYLATGARAAAAATSRVV